MGQTYIARWLSRCIAVLMLVTGSSAHAGTVLVAAASDLKFALEAIKSEYLRDHPIDLQLVFGSSGNFYRQIRQGAPFQLFLSADEAYVNSLEKAGMTAEPGFVYGIGRLVYFAPTGSPLDPRQGVASLQLAAKTGQVNRFAIANPNHAPYGRAAKQVLESLDIHSILKPTLVMGENVSQAAQFAVSGNTDGGLFAYSLALDDKVAKQGGYQLVPAELHLPLRQKAALLRGSDAESSAFYGYLQSERAQAVLARYGFSRPQD